MPCYCMAAVQVNGLKYSSISKAFKSIIKLISPMHKNISIQNLYIIGESSSEPHTSENFNHLSLTV